MRIEIDIPIGTPQESSRDDIKVTPGTGYKVGEQITLRDYKSPGTVIAIDSSEPIDQAWYDCGLLLREFQR